MSISLTGTNQPQADCINPPHAWDIKGSHDLNPVTGKQYGNSTPGTCRKCKLEMQFNSGMVQHTKDDFFLDSKRYPE